MTNQEMRTALTNAGRPVAANASATVVLNAYNAMMAESALTQRFSASVVEASERVATAQRNRGLAPWQGAIPQGDYTFQPFLGKWKGEQDEDFALIAQELGLEIPQGEGVSSVHLAIMDGETTVAKATWESVTSKIGTNPNDFLDGQTFKISAVAVTGNDRRELVFG